jgi:phosphohistidine phosphatase
MAIYLVQHGEALPKEQDPERSLSETGRAETRRIAEVAAGYNVRVNKIEHSGKKRAQQTAEIVGELLKPEQGVTQRDGLAPKDDVQAITGSLVAGSNLMLVGHLPFVERLVGQLVDVFFPHVIASVATRTYSPGLLTGLLFVLPSACAFLLHSFSAGLLEVGHFLIVSACFIPALLLSIPILFWIGGRLEGVLNPHGHCRAGE